MESYKIILYNNYENAEKFKILEVKEDEKIKLPKSLYRAGYEFAGWYTKKNGGKEFKDKYIKEDISLYAHWNIKDLSHDDISNNKEYNFRIISASEHGIIYSDHKDKYSAGEKIEIEAFSFGGYTFDRWVSDSNVEFNNEEDYKTTFIMPSHSVEIKAEFVVLTNDDIPNEVKTMAGISRDEVDSDDDGLTNAFEYYFLNTDFLNDDTDEDGIKDADEDYDEDGITNIEEYALGTDPGAKDSDYDRINDFDELYKYKTNPLKEDTDEDGVNDNKELQLGTNPLVFDEKFHIILHEDFGAVSIKPSVEIELRGEQVKTLTINWYENSSLLPKYMPGYIGEAYDFKVDGEFDEAKISFEFDPESLPDGADPTIYYFNYSEQELEALETEINGNIASAVVSHFSIYILLDRVEFEKSFEWVDSLKISNPLERVEIAFVIDDSGSMTGSDSMNKRLEVAKTLIDNLPPDSGMAIVRFDGSNPEILTETMIKDKELSKTYLTEEFFKSNGGTDMYEGIEKALTLFETEDKNTLKAIVVLSDGVTSDSSMHDSVINTSQNQSVKIYSVGLGSDISYFNRFLKPLSIKTGGEFYLSANADALASIYLDINNKIDLTIDSDMDGLADYYENNLPIFNGNKLRLNKNNPDTDGDGLLDGEEVIVKLILDENYDNNLKRVKGKILSNPTLINTDNDAYNDYQEIKVFNSDAFTKSLVMHEDNITKLQFGQYNAEIYKECYDESLLMRGSIWIGHNIYGNAERRKAIYKRALLDYFERINTELQEEYKMNNAYETSIRISDSCRTTIRGLKKYYETHENVADATHYIENLDSQITHHYQSLDELKNLNPASVKDFNKQAIEIHTDFVNKLRQKAELQDAIHNSEAGLSTIDLKIPEKLGKYAKIADKTLNFIELGKPVFDGFNEYVELKSKFDVICDNMYILDTIRENTTDAALKKAADELYLFSKNQYNIWKANAYDIAKNTILFYVHNNLVKYNVYVFWAEVGRQAGNLLFNPAGTAKTAISVYSMGESAKHLSDYFDDLLQSNASKKVAEGNGLIYLIENENAYELIKQYRNLAEIRIFGEEMFIELQEESINFFNKMFKSKQKDSEEFVDISRNKINTLKSIKHLYNGKYQKDKEEKNE